MRLTRLSNISLAKAISLAALTAFAIAVAIGFLANSPTDATAFNADASSDDTQHVPIPAQYTALCSNGVAVPDPANNPGLVSDCAALFASKETLEGTDGNLNWSASRAIDDWDNVGRAHNGIVTANSRVSELWLYGDLNGTIPGELGNLSNLRGLHISADMTGEIPAELVNLSNLTVLNISYNDLTGEIPAELGNLANLKNLELSGNELTGEIPAELGNLANLGQLRLDYNGLAGAIPSELGNLANLKNLNLNNNELTGEIPAELGSLANLKNLILDYNGLTGEIPAELGNLANLEYLYLNNNKLTDAIPAQLGNLADLGDLRLHNNKLTGAIPAELGNLQSLDYLSLHDNQFTECIPRSLRDAKFEFALAEPIGVPFCATPTSAATPTPTATPAASNDVINRLIVDLADLREQVSVLATRVADIENRSDAAPPTPTATSVSVPGATPSPTPTSVPGASGGSACIERLADSTQVSGRWTTGCLSANSPDDGNAYYARFYTFTLVAASDVTITLTAAKPPYIYLLEGVGRDGNFLQGAGDSSRTSQTIAASLLAGSYTIEASTWNPNVTGDFTLTLDTGQ